MKQTLSKAVALTIFIAGIITFVLFQSDLILIKNDTQLQSSHNGGAVVKQAKNDSTRQTILSSSKTYILTKKIPLTSNELQKPDTTKFKTLSESKTIIPAKSPLKTTNPPINDSIKPNRKKKNVQNQP